MSELFKSSIVYKPFHYPLAVDITIAHEKIHWVEQEVELADDVEDWKSGRLTPEEKHFITQVLRLFTASDVAVGGYYYDHLIPVLQNNQVRVMLGSFAAREGTHQRAYSLIQETLGLPESEYHAFLEVAAMAEKAEHMVDADTSTVPGLLRALAKGICNEGISLFSSFAMLLSFQMDGKMRGMGKAVEWSQRDETVHVEGLAYVFASLAADMPEHITPELKLTIYDMVRKTVELEDAFIDTAFEMGGIKRVTAAEVKSYIRYIADRRLVQIGLKENWAIADNPLPWVDTIVGAVDHTNFFEGKVTEYEAGSLTGEWHYPAVATTQGFLVWTKDNCPHCTDAKAMLEQAGLPFSTVDLSDDAARAQFYLHRAFTGTRGPRAATMPKVYEVVRSGANITTALLGGASDLRAVLTSRGAFPATLPSGDQP